MLPGVGGLVAGSLLAPALLARMSATHLLTAMLALAAAGAATLTQLQADEGLAALIVGTTLIGLGTGAVGTLATDLVVGAAPAERAGAASAISETGAELGGALGISILGSIGIAIYRGEVGRSMPVDVPAAVADAARDTLGGAIGAASQLPTEIGTALASVARSAFVEGMQVAATISAVVAVGVAILALIALRDVRTDPEPAIDVDDNVSAPASREPQRAIRPSGAPVPEA
jgi:DHA2 family multidrug resistance protein-like MFS transporter